MGRNRSSSHPDRVDSPRTRFFECVFFKRLAVSNEFFLVLSGPNQLFRALSRSERPFSRALRCSQQAFLVHFAVPRNFLNGFRALSRPRAARGAHWKATGRQKYAQLGPTTAKWTPREAKRASRHRSKRNKQENVKKRAPLMRELDFRSIREVSNKRFRAFRRSRRFLF